MIGHSTLHKIFQGFSPEPSTDALYLITPPPQLVGKVQRPAPRFKGAGIGEAPVDVEPIRLLGSPATVITKATSLELA